MSTIKYLVCVCSGGLGNRLRPLASCKKLAEKTGRELLVWWIIDHRCNAEFNDLYQNKFNFIDEDYIYAIGTLSKVYYHSLSAIQLSAEIVGIPLMIDICSVSEKKALGLLYDSLPNDKNEYVFVFSDNFIWYGFSEKDFINNLMPTVKIISAIDYFTEDLILDKDVIGVHARGTDFFVGADFYINRMKKIEEVSSDVEFYLATDDKDYENKIMDSFKEGKIIVLPNKEYASKKDENKGFQYNTLISKKAAIDSVVEMYLLAKTNIIVGNERSTYYQICKNLSNQ